jgi:3-phosphoshikimate 1-carboxyvinyltransferase
MTIAGYPSEILIERWTVPAPRASARVPGSKSLTNRALVVAALAHGPSVLRGALDCEDTQVMVAALRNIGIDVKHDTSSALITVEGCTGVIPSSHASLSVANSGTSLRFLTAILATGQGTFRLDGSPRMRERPISDLLDALNDLGAKAQSDLGTGCPPVTIEASGLEGGSVFVRGDVSSQFLSGLLIALPVAKQPTSVEVHGVLVSQPYVAMTLYVMDSFGVTAANRDFRRFDVPTATYIGRDYAIEPDASAASYFFALAAMTGGAITVEGLGTSSIQGDMAFVDVLERMGCAIKREPSRTTVIAGPLHAVDVDMNAFSDTVMTLAVVALFARGVTRIHNVAHIRHKETDRIAALAAELRKLGAQVDEFADGLAIDPPHRDRLHGAKIHTYNDHRMAMSFALAGLLIPGVIIVDPGCVKKTYPDFWTDLEALRAGSQVNRPQPSERA